MRRSPARLSAVFCLRLPPLCSSSRIFLPCCSSATTASRPMASSRSFPMNDLAISDRNDVIIRDRQDNRPADRNFWKPKQPRQLRHGWGGRLFALGGCVLLAGGLSLGAWGKYSQQQQ